MKRLKYRSIKSLASDLQCSEAQAKTIKSIHKKGIPYATFQTDFPITYKWYKSCFHTPPPWDIKMEIYNEILGLHGVEGFTRKSGTTVDYCNTGETYATTIILTNGALYIGDWGSIAEKDL